MSIIQHIDSLKARVKALRSACDSVLEELEVVRTATASTPRARADKKSERVDFYARCYAEGRVRKPKSKIKNATSAT